MKDYIIENKEDAIIGFRNEYFFLSNFYEGEVFEYKGCKFTNGEAAFHSQKCPNKIKKFEMLRPSQSKKLGRNVQLREDWEQIKDEIMYEVCYAKFSQNEFLKNKLLNIKFNELIEFNTWNDKCWGMIYKDGKLIGENRLGIVLMKLKENLKNE